MNRFKRRPGGQEAMPEWMGISGNENSDTLNFRTSQPGAQPATLGNMSDRVNLTLTQFSPIATDCPKQAPPSPTCWCLIFLSYIQLLFPVSIRTRALVVLFQRPWVWPMPCGEPGRAEMCLTNLSYTGLRRWPRCG
jgi:hypothetical protein